MNILLRVGTWIEKRFPEKVSAEELYTKLSCVVSAANHQAEDIKTILDRIHSLEMLYEEVKKVKEELAVFRNQSIVKTRMTPPAIHPFASRLPINNGGNASPQ